MVGDLPKVELQVDYELFGQVFKYTGPVRDALMPTVDFLCRVASVIMTGLGGWNMITSVLTAHEATPDHTSATANGKFIMEVVGIVLVAAGLIVVVCRPYM